MRLLAIALSMLALVTIPASASAAFPGRDGLLAVQPLTGRGIVVVEANGQQTRRLCTSASCGQSRVPRWSPDGRTRAVDASTDALLYADGSCLDCEWGNAHGLAFTANPTLLTGIAGGNLVLYGIDGRMKGTVVSGPLSDAVWSRNGKLAVVRSGAVWAGSPRHLQRVARGRSPSWSPDGSRLTLARNGWVELARVGTRSARRLVRGGAPAWSPDRNSIAFIDPSHDLRVIPVTGGRARRVGTARGFAVDWQRRPTPSPPTCAPPPGSTVLADTPEGVVTADSGRGGGVATLGCVAADGRERMLETFAPPNIDQAYSVSQAVIGGQYAALVNSFVDEHYGGSSYTVKVFDLATGSESRELGGETADCGDFGSCASYLGECDQRRRLLRGGRRGHRLLCLLVLD